MRDLERLLRRDERAEEDKERELNISAFGLSCLTCDRCFDCDGARFSRE